MKLATWTKPGTTETRVYFNGIQALAISGIKVFAVEQDGIYIIKFSGGLHTSQQDSIIDQIDGELETLNGGERVVKFADLLKLVK